MKAAFWVFILASSQARGYSGDAGFADFATQVFAFNSINGNPGYGDPTKALGFPPALATPAVPDNSKAFSFGWGGSITLGFAKPVINQKVGSPGNPAGVDLIVFGNAFYVGGNINAAWIEPGVVDVGVDVNGDGVPDAGDQWYRLAPESPVAGLPLANSFFGNVPAGTVVGYADVTPITNLGNPLIPDDPHVLGINPGSAGGDGFNLDSAVDLVKGRPVQIRVAHFVRISHAGNASLGILGVSSTEVSAVAIVRQSITAPTP